MYDLSEKYKHQMAQKVDELRAISYKLGIPCFMAFGTGQDEAGDFQIEATGLIPELFDIQSNDRRFEDFILVQAGFHAIAPSLDVTMDKENILETGQGMEDTGRGHEEDFPMADVLDEDFCGNGSLFERHEVMGTTGYRKEFSDMADEFLREENE